MYADYSGEFSGVLSLAGLATAALLLTITALVYDATHEKKIAEAAENVIGAITDTVNNIAESIKSLADSKEEAIVAPSTTTVIYRYGGANPGNLTPKEKDKFSGLSFSTVPMPGSVMTTIEELNATGVVYAVKDGATHVSVKPVGATVEDWINAGSSSIWTQAVKSTVVKWDGGS